MQAMILDGTAIRHTTDPREVRAAHAAGLRMWVDIEARSPEVEALLAETFAIHPLVIEDIWLDRSIPKVDAFERYHYLVLHGVPRTSVPEDVKLFVLDLVVSPSFVLTQHADAALGDEMRTQLVEAPRLLADGSAWLAHAILDRMVDRFLPLIDKFGERLDRLERDVVFGGIRSRETSLMPVIFALKRSIQRLCRITHHQRAILERLSRAESEEIPRAAIPYFRDVADHFIRVAELADTYQDVAANTLDAYLSVQSNRMDATMKTLTLMSTVMLPLNLIAGIYGMNFHHMPETSWEYGYPMALITMVLVAAGITYWFKHKEWV